MRTKTVHLVFVGLVLIAAYALRRNPALISGKSFGPPAATNLNAFPVLAQNLLCGLWRVDHGFNSTIQIKNSLVVGPAVVTPTLYMADGTAYALPPVRLATAGVATVSVNDALARAPSYLASHLSQYGSATLSYTGLSMSVLGSMDILDPTASLVFGYAFDTPMDMATGQQILEGMWWKHDPGVGGFVSLANTTGTAKRVSFQVIGADGSTLRPESVEVGAHATQLLDLDRLIAGLPGLESEVGGIRVTYAGMSGDIIVGGGLENDREGYSAGLPFWSRDAMSRPTEMTVANVGLQLGEPDPRAGFPGGTFFTPYLILRNVTLRPTEVHATLYVVNGAQHLPIALPNLHLSPNQSQQVDLKAILASLGLDRTNGSANLILSYRGNAGDLGVAAGSVDQTATYVFGVMPQQAMQTLSKEVPYWTVANGFDTMFSLWNPTDQAQDIVAILYYGDGSGKYQLPLHIGPQASAMIDMAQLISSQQPDSSGKLFPTWIREGSVVFESSQGFTAPMNLSINAATFNTELATCLQHCICCTGVSTTALTPNPCDMAVGASMQATTTAYYNNGTNSNVTNSVSWSSSNTSISTVSSAGLVKGISVGSATLSAKGSFTRPGQVCGVGNLVWATVILTATAPADVMTVSETPAQLPMSTGDTKQITVNVSPNNITVTTLFRGQSPPSVNPDSQCAASLTIPGQTGQGSLASNVSASPANCSGIFSVTGSAAGVSSSNDTTVEIPPQVLIQMEQAEAGGTNQTAMNAVADVARNRIHSTLFDPPYSSYQNTIVSGQFALSSTTTGIEPELDIAIGVFSGVSGSFCNSLAFWTPTSGQWQTVQQAISSGTTTFPSGTGAPTYSSWSQQNQQILYVSNVGTQATNGAPNFLFLAQRTSTQPAAVNASCTP